MMQLRRLPILLILLTFSTSFANAQALRETSGGQKIIGTGNENQTYYAGALAYGETGQVYMYVQGDSDLADKTYYDQVYLYTHPNDWNGLTTPFQFVKRLLPTGSFASQHYYGQPSVCGYAGDYYMTAFEAPDPQTFLQQLWGVSIDGENWSWYRLLTWTGDGRLQKIPGISLQSKMIAGVRYFFGFIEIWSDAGIGTGVIRLRYNPAKARRYDQIEVFAHDTNSWQIAVADPDTNPNGNFSVLPKKLWDGRYNPRYLNSPNEIWFTVKNGAKNCTSCETFSGTYRGQGDRIEYRTVTLPTTLDGVPTLGPPNTVTSDQNIVRCMPGKYENSRLYPQPLAGGSPRLLYTSVNDQKFGSNFNYCGNTALDTFPGMYIVVTGLQ